MGVDVGLVSQRDTSKTSYFCNGQTNYSCVNKFFFKGIVLLNQVLLIISTPLRRRYQHRLFEKLRHEVTIIPLVSEATGSRYMEQMPAVLGKSFACSGSLYFTSAVLESTRLLRL